MKNDIIFAREISALRFMRVKDERFMAALPPLHVEKQRFIKQFLLCFFLLYLLAAENIACGS